ncbi:3-oxoacyl-[acyl-carrier-protein] synthase III C-terminal domain-containing protein [Asticcacaulis sp. BYS171W]|uniref:3-oxoacyl-[acyl-carrier-protein] synthase III C-terminal domain-containing protein n=1 Tax=Asticcacaulis aquaticus TaxID=2984212 RepID=A0ABT5HWZ7_9CAUL|nr:3-oxoacyl-[acyl-carrier-protein] synthase III C-terminal domain-containing protein [Asticcacaulis aquaticus]MDC7684600.1 3-oxoacyl-[acyl-carrier-protein] synthase III C-terminal domain-containing protein [Asticcacaulis aquaticus]
MTFPIGVRLAGLGRYRPRVSQPSTALDARFGEAGGWTEARFGIGSRGIAARDETTSFMAAEACREALKQAGWSDGAFDLLVGACGVMEQPIPGTAPLVQDRLGLARSGIVAFDINMTCLSFLQALDTVSLYIAAGRCRRAVIFASDIASAGLDYSRPEISAIFGDGAAAVCVEASSEGPAVLGSVFATFSTGKDTAVLRAGGTKVRIEDGIEALRAAALFQMDPFAVFKAAGRHVPVVLDKVMAQAGLTLDAIDTIVCHQASQPGLEYIRHLVKVRPERVVDIFADHGNQIAASLPSALYAAQVEGRLTPGSTALLLGTSAGVSIGAMVLRL